MWGRSEMDTWGRGDVGTWGRGDVGAWGRVDVETWERGDVETWEGGDVETSSLTRRAGGRAWKPRRQAVGRVAGDGGLVSKRECMR